MFAVRSICGLSKTNRSITILMKIVPSSVKTAQHHTETSGYFLIYSAVAVAVAVVDAFFLFFLLLKFVTRSWADIQKRNWCFKRTVSLFLCTLACPLKSVAIFFFCMIHQKLFVVCFAMYRFPVLLNLTFQKQKISKSKIEYYLWWTWSCVICTSHQIMFTRLWFSTLINKNNSKTIEVYQMQMLYNLKQMKFNELRLRAEIHGKKRSKTKAVHRFIVSKSIWNRVAVQLKRRQENRKFFCLRLSTHSKFIPHEQNQNEKTARKKTLKLSHICARHTQKRATIIVKMKLCYEFCIRLCVCVDRQRHKLEQKRIMMKMHLIQLSHPNNCAPCSNHTTTKNAHKRELKSIYLWFRFVFFPICAL